jgi:periplasmic divalent cation tolerance protein
METTPPSATDVVVALTSLPPSLDAAGFVRALLERRLIACGTLLPAARSLYTWEGAIEDAQETVVLLKTTAASIPALREQLPSLHPYQVPELLVLPCSDGLPAYLGWVADAVAGYESTP